MGTLHCWHLTYMMLLFLCFQTCAVKFQNVWINDVTDSILAGFVTSLVSMIHSKINEYFKKLVSQSNVSAQSGSIKLSQLKMESTFTNSSLGSLLLEM